MMELAASSKTTINSSICVVSDYAEIKQAANSNISSNNNFPITLNCNCVSRIIVISKIGSYFSTCSETRIQTTIGVVTNDTKVSQTDICSPTCHNDFAIRLKCNIVCMIGR